LQGDSTDPTLKHLPSLQDADKERFTKTVKELAVITNTNEKDLLNHVKTLRPDLIIDEQPESKQDESKPQSTANESYSNQYIKYIDNLYI
jgi:hypothetical protein